MNNSASHIELAGMPEELSAENLQPLRELKMRRFLP